MPRIVASRTSADGLNWYHIACERCGEHLGALYAGMWTREQADDYPCHVCEPRAVGAVTLDPDPQDALDFEGGEDMALYAVDSTYQTEFHERLRERLSVFDRKGGR